jgi:pimeloyl-ACP methyl ester carboxylesterase
MGDMADDAVAVLDALALASANVVGISLGGVIAQVMAVHHPSRVRSLVSISSAPSASYRPRLVPMIRLGRIARRAERGRISTEEAVLGASRIAGSPRYPRDAAWLLESARRSEKYPMDEDKNIRQTAAFQASGDRRRELARIAVPTLVLHGVADPMFPVGAGRATADAIPGARFVAYPGMGHDLPRELWPTMVDEIAATAALASPAMG